MKSALLCNWGCNRYNFFSFNTNLKRLKFGGLVNLWHTSKLLTLLVPLSSKTNAEVLPLNHYFAFFQSFFVVNLSTKQAFHGE